MSRERMVTRTIPVTTVTALFVNADSQKVFTHEIILSGRYKDNKVLMKALESSETDNCKVVRVISTKVEEILYGMTEQEFILSAKKLPPRSVKEN